MKNRKKGFTIVELVIVIAVIGILSAILIPTFAGLTKNAQEKALQEGLRNSYVAYSVDYADQEGYVSEENAYLSASESASASMKVYKLDAKGVWQEVNVSNSEGEGYVDPANLSRAQHEVDGVDTDVEAYNGYYLYVLAV